MAARADPGSLGELSWTVCAGTRVARLLVGRALDARRAARNTAVVCAHGSCGRGLSAEPLYMARAIFPFTLFRRLSSEHDFYVQQAAELISIPQYLARYGASSAYIWLSLLLLAAAGFSFVAPVRFRTFRLLAFLSFSWLGLLATRNQPQFAMVAGTVLVWNVSDWLRQRAGSTAHRQTLIQAGAATVLVCLIVLVGTGFFYRLDGEGRLVGME